MKSKKLMSCIFFAMAAALAFQFLWSTLQTAWYLTSEPRNSLGYLVARSTFNLAEFFRISFYNLGYAILSFLCGRVILVENSSDFFESRENRKLFQCSLLLIIGYSSVGDYNLITNTINMIDKMPTLDAARYIGWYLITAITNFLPPICLYVFTSNRKQ